MRKLYDEYRKDLQQLAPLMRPALQPLDPHCACSVATMTCHLHHSEDAMVQSNICEMK
jgi:hypothetical protein